MKTNKIDTEEQLGGEIGRLRRNRRMTQVELALRMKMATSQLCKIENGKHHATTKTLNRIENALNIPPSTLEKFRATLELQKFDNDNREPMEIALPQRTEHAPAQRFAEIKLHESSQSTESNQLIEEVTRIADNYIKLEDQAGISLHFTRFNCFDQLLNAGEGDAITLAHVIRNSLGLGSAPLTGLIPLIESQNVRIIFTEKLTSAIHAKSFFDKRYQNLIVCLYDRSSPERQLADLAQEIAYACLYFRNHLNPVCDTRENIHFTRSFARALLIPLPGLKYLCESLEINRHLWTLPLVCQLKWRFGVSAQLFLYQLQAMNLIDPYLFSKLQDELTVHYSKTAELYGQDTDEYLAHIEPDPRAAPLLRNSWLTALETRNRHHEQ